ncbi:GNAT family N-acetyltransferase [Nocardioides sp. zg-1228]|uniref:GNAT family N-acetyltransferase n=1 Tax=Nocardioides sp. zg-1228 TaxID=2763008 RepID=UPI00164329F5|nr:GNAT family N-acetyltransferase [Nocardioides sp. zg-1228]MBC2932819.1 GNAT family N-acetyltransferase [Nocardioides sp. zg-1228]QSF56966.1 GNAT family N-acetyltransferase [Nocardioides sp. zg-1228]
MGEAAGETRGDGFITHVITHDIRLRPGTTADIPAFRALGEAVVPATYGPIDAAYAQRMLDEWWVPEVFERSLARNAHLVAEVDGQVVAMAAFGRLSQSHRDFPHVTGDREVMWKLYVHPDHQGRGIGGRLLAEVEAMVEGDVLWLEVVDGNQQAYDFYRAHGFTEVERVTDRDWPDDVWLRKELGRGPR